MIGFFQFLKIDGLLVATTIGAGIFALPYVFYKSGWILGLGYLVFFALVMVLTHSLYWQVLAKEREREGLLGLARDYLGKLGFWAGFFAILGGLIFAQVVFLVLSTSFFALIFPEVGFTTAVLILWAFGSGPLILGFRRFVALELSGGLAMIAVIFLIFLNSLPLGDLTFVPAVNFENAFLPFGAILFSLAAWTAIEPMMRATSPEERFKRSGQWGKLFLGTYGVAAIYAIFVLAILASAGEITPDTVGGFAGASSLTKILFGIFGLFSLWTTHLPIGLESRALIERDLKQSKILSLTVTAFLPLLLVGLGMTNFLNAVVLVEGVFLALQYFLLILVARKALRLGFFMRLATFLAALIFAAGALYEIYFFVIR